ncbi:MAG TPA: hypothetical protein VK986_08315 [Tepidisphaeraceae bacterium]|nr:hypothetical protein [Tepidisphaeraceae bacterium]
MRRPLLAAGLVAMLTGAYALFGVPRVSAKEEVKEEGYVELFEDADFKGRRVKIAFKQDVPRLNDVSSDDGQKGFNDWTSSVRWKFPPGWKATLHDDADYKDRGVELLGTGQLESKANLNADKFNDKTSSVRWIETK